MIEDSSDLFGQFITAVELEFFRAPHEFARPTWLDPGQVLLAPLWLCQREILQPVLHDLHDTVLHDIT